MSSFRSSHVRNRVISFSSRSAFGATKWTFSLPIGPETTCIGSASTLRQPPTVILCIPLRPVGNKAACQPNNRSFVSGLKNCCVASSIISTMPSTSRLAGISPAISIPSLRATDERTSSGFRCSPSIADDLTISLVRVVREASRLNIKPSPSIRPSKRPCRCRISASFKTKAFVFHINFGQFLCS